MTKEELIEQLEKLAEEWEGSFTYSDDPEYGNGYDSAKQSAAWDLQDLIEEAKK